MIFIEEYFKSVKKKIHGPSGRKQTTATLEEKREGEEIHECGGTPRRRGGGQPGTMAVKCTGEGRGGGNHTSVTASTAPSLRTTEVSAGRSALRCREVVLRQNSD